jgi:hypothetical protein
VPEEDPGVRDPTPSRDDYRTVQQIYRGWSLLGVVVAALLASVLLAYLVRDNPRLFVPAALAFGCIAATRAVFWLWTFPVNQATSNWARLPDNWATLRLRWELSHAASAALNLAALLCLATALARQFAL